jgi:hypothetical protein
MGLTITLRPTAAAHFGFATTVLVTMGPACEDGAQALVSLREMLGPIVTG